MTRDMSELYVWILKKGFSPSIRVEHDYTIELVGSSGARHQIMLVPNDLLRAMKYGPEFVDGHTSPFFKRLKHVWDKDYEHKPSIGQRETQAPSPPRFVPSDRRL